MKHINKNTATTDSQSLTGKNELAPSDSSKRLHSIDFFRGVALTIVLVDHVDFFARDFGFFRDWTLMGLGFSDAAEAFVFLSGVTFGWVYTPKLARDGWFCVQVRVVKRFLQIYFAYLMTVGIVVFLRYCFSSIFPSDIAIPDSSVAQAALLQSLYIRYQPFAVGILCLYLVVLPFLPLVLRASQFSSALVLALSGALYGLVQLHPNLSLTNHAGSNWFFNPLAWQFMMTSGVIAGKGLRTGRIIRRKSTLLVALSISIVIFGLWVFKGDMFLDMDGLIRAGHKSVITVLGSRGLTSKSGMGPIRVLHFFAIAYLMWSYLPSAPSFWSRIAVKPFVICGRNSLATYCFGVILAYVSGVVLSGVGPTQLLTLVVALDAVFLQFVFSWIIDRSRAPQHS